MSVQTVTLPMTPYRARLLECGTKVCRGCKRELPIAHFLVETSFGPYCTDCRTQHGFRYANPLHETSDKKVCPDCDKEKPLMEFLVNTKFGPRCHQCRMNRRRTYYRNYQRGERATERGQARKIVCIALKSGRLVRPTVCEQCGKRTSKQDIHAHHPDYSKPLTIKWLCPECHRLAHSEVSS
jgi:hypothetical protein